MSSNRRAIVIGTGAGGLAASAYLAKRGFDTLAVEQADKIGGLIGPFERDGFQFSLGLHYVGMCRPGDLVHETLAGIGLDAGALFCDLDPDGFEAYRFPDLEVRRCCDTDAYRERLAALFPEDAEGLRRLFALGADVQAFEETGFRLLEGSADASDLRAALELPTVLRYAGSTMADLLAETLSSPRARAVLAASCGLYGLPPSRAPAMAWLMVLMHYSRGAFAPRGGSGGLRDALAGAAQGYGARLRTHAPVRRILVERGRATGVELEDGERILADVVVSDADPTLTFGKLVAPEELPSRLLRKVARTEPSLPSFAVFLGLRRDVREHGLGRFSVFLHPSQDIESTFAARYAGGLPPKLNMFIASGSVMDDTGRTAPPGCSTLTIVTEVPYSMFRAWEGLPPGHRGADYAELKERIAERLLVDLEAQWPGLVGDIAVREVSTPLTNVDWARAVQGGAYGPALTMTQWGPFRYHTKTPIKNLFQAGAGVLSHSVAASLFTGKLAALAAGGAERG
jgi:phytoene desaturase